MGRLIRIVLLMLGLAFIALSVCSPRSPIASTLEPLKTEAANLLATATKIPTQEYVLQPGDTPSGVALMFGTTVETLVALNAELHPEMGQTPMKFNAGWRILVPAQGNVAIASGGSTSEVIQSPTAVVNDGSAASGNAADGSFDYDGALELIRLTNEERAKAGVPSLAIDEALMELARKRATEIVNDWGHQGLDDDCPECGENITKFGSASRQFQSWMSSDGHRGNILAIEYTAVGVGRFIIGGKAYASQLFK